MIVNYLEMNKIIGKMIKNIKNIERNLSVKGLIIDKKLKK